MASPKLKARRRAVYKHGCLRKRPACRRALGGALQTVIGIIAGGSAAVTLAGTWAFSLAAGTYGVQPRLPAKTPGVPPRANAALQAVVGIVAAPVRGGGAGWHLGIFAGSRH